MKTRGITVGILILVLWAFMLFNAEWLFGEYASTAETTLQIYMIFVGIVLASTQMKLPGLELKPGRFMYFGLFFLLTYLAMGILPDFVMGAFASFEGVRATVALGALYSFVKAYPEEVVFRDILPTYMGGKWKYVAQVLFGLFHVGVLAQMTGMTTGGIVLGFFLLTGLGVVWLWIAEEYGIMAATGSHTGYNLAIIAGGAMLI